MAMLADLLKDFLREGSSNSSADTGVRDPSEFGGSSADSGVKSPDKLMEQMLPKDPRQITTDSGQAIDYDFKNWLRDKVGANDPNSNPFREMIDKLPAGGQGTITGFLKNILGTDKSKLVPGTGTVGGGEPDHVPGTGQDAALSPTPMKDQKQPKFADNGKVLPPIEPGNIDLSTRPQHVNPDGTVSTVLTKSYNFDGREVLLPTIADDGTPLNDQQAIAQYRQTGKHLGVYSNPASADAYGKIIHNQQASQLKYAQPTALDPTAIEQLRQSLLGQAGQNDPSNPNGLAGRMSGPNSKVDMKVQNDEMQTQADQLNMKKSSANADKRNQR